MNGRLFLVSSVLPHFCKELESLLRKAVATATPSALLFCTQPKPEAAYPIGSRTIAFYPDQGMIILDVVSHQIAHVEVLDRDEVECTY